MDCPAVIQFRLSGSCTLLDILKVMFTRRDIQFLCIGALLAAGITLLSVGLIYGSDIKLILQSKYLPPTFQIPREVNTDYVIDIIDSTNKERQKANLQPLKENSALSYAAYLRAKDILKFQDFSHEATKSGNREVRYVSQVVGYRYSNIGENLALGGDDPNSVMAGWLNSTGHKDNILNRDFDETGVAILNGDFQDNGDTYIVVQLFGKL